MFHTHKEKYLSLINTEYVCRACKKLEKEQQKAKGEVQQTETPDEVEETGTLVNN